MARVTLQLKPWIARLMDSECHRACHYRCHHQGGRDTTLLLEVQAEF